MRLSLRSLPGFRRLFKPSHEERRRRAAEESQRRVQQELYLLQLLQTARYADPRHLAHFEAQVFSQNGEDGIIGEILRRIGTTNRIFVEIGAGHGIEANTAYLLRKGWKGIWVEADPRAVRSIRTQFAGELESGQLYLVHSFVTRENASELLRSARVPEEFDVVSIDVDRNTSHVWRALSGFRPRVVVIEYNASIPPSDEWEVPYDAGAVWDESSYFGASLKSLERLGAERGYVLVGCERTGLNAFFVRADAARDHFAGPLNAEACYEPPRYFLTREWGHPRRWVEERLQRRRTWASSSASRAVFLAPLAIGLAACAHATSTTPDVPIAFGRWRPPEGQACYADAFQPRELPPVSALLDSAAVVGELRARAPGSVLIALTFDSLGRTGRARVIDRRMALGAADSVRALVMMHLRAPRNAEEWGARLLVSTGESAALALARRELCPPTLARIEPLALGKVALVERDPELTPSPDWIVRGAGPPAGPPRSTIEKAVAGTHRDTTRVTVDSTSTSPDVTALGTEVLTLRVLIDTTGTIAHAEISRAAAATIDRVRLVTELARYRFHPALEDRVRTPWWVILRIK